MTEIERTGQARSTMDPEELTEIVERLRIQHNDDENVEAKKCEAKLSNDVWESVSAFGNTSGGLILLGLDQENGFTVPPKFDIDKSIEQFVSGIQPRGGKLTNPPQYDLARVGFEGSQILAIRIAEVDLARKPCFITSRGVENGSYKRVADKDMKLSATEIFALQNALVPSPADKEIVPEASVNDLSEETINKIIANEKVNHPKALRGAKTIQAQMARLNITDQNGRIRLGGLLAAGNYPQQFFPKLAVDVMVHPDIEKSAPTGPRYLDRTVCEGEIGEVIEDAVAATAKNLRRISVIEGAGRKDELEIPEEVLREAIANAVIHREYGPRHVGQSVTVDIYPDRVEITNPGGLWGGKTLDNIADGTSLCRNAALMRLMSAVELPGGTGRPAEGGGGGVPFMIRVMQSKTLTAPDFKADIDSFRVRLGRSGTEIAANREWISRVTKRELSQHEQSLLLTMKKMGTSTVQELHRSLMIDSDEIREAASRFEREGIVSHVYTDTYKMLADDSGKHPTPEVEDVLLSILQTDKALSIQEIAEMMGKTVPSTRYHVKKLVDAGLAVPTASSTSRSRKYLRKQASL